MATVRTLDEAVGCVVLAALVVADPAEYGATLFGGMMGSWAVAYTTGDTAASSVRTSLSFAAILLGNSLEIAYIVLAARDSFWVCFIRH